jgi:hypothetical protein
MISMRGGEERAIAVFREAGDSLSYPILEISLKNNENDRIENAAMEINVAASVPHFPPR